MNEHGSNRGQLASVLLDAVKAGDDDDLFNCLIRCREHINVRDTGSNGYAAIHYAAEKGRIETLRMLLLAGAEVNARTGEAIQDIDEIVWHPGYTALMLAARYCQSQAVDILIASGACPHSATEEHWTALHAAAVGGEVSIVKRLLSLKVDHSIASGERQCDEQLGWFFLNTPMHLAASNGNAAVVSCLLDHGASPYESWADGRTPIFYAAAYGQHEVIRVLCDFGVDPNARESRREYGFFLDNTPLHYAAINGHGDAVKTLLDMGAEPRIVESHSKQTAAQAAKAAGHNDVVRILQAAKKR